MTDWLSKHIQEQAAYYGMAVDQYTSLMRGAAAYQELIEDEDVPEPASESDGGGDA